MTPPVVRESADGVEVETAPAPAASVIWLHGLGADGYDFLPVVDELGLLPAIRFVFPHAPWRPVTINDGMVMRAWYDVLALQGPAREDEGGIRDSARRIEALAAREVERGIAPDRLVLAGFSQGGALALHVGLRHPARLAGLLVLSGYLPLARAAAVEASPAGRTIPVFLAHGTADTLLPVARAHATRAALAALGVPLEYREYPVAHAVCEAELRDVAAWLAARL